MANTSKLAVLAMLVILLHVSTGAVAWRHGKPDPCGGEDAAGRDSVPGMRHRNKEPRCSSPPAEGSSGGHGGTPAVMTVNGFQRGQEGGGPAACDGKYHSDRDMIVALSTRWYEGGRRCHRRIRITSTHGGRTVEATVVDECDSRRGCRDNIVDTSAAVWKALGLDTNAGVVPVTWSDA